jgi:superfamily I DNA/RNA helicase
MNPPNERFDRRQGRKMRETDHLIVLKAVTELPFSVGRKLLVDILRGEEDNPSIKNNRLGLLPSFASMSYSEEELEDLIDSLLREGYLEYTNVPQNKYWKVLQLTERGRSELRDPNRQNKRAKHRELGSRKTEITDKDREMFSEFSFFLGKYNDEQKKAITSPAEKIICIAGAGSGKTSVLTKRIEFLIKFRSVKPGKILAITFTRKARQEMINRLEKDGINDVRIETFNSFCEKILTLHEKRIYGKQMKVMTYKDRIFAVKKALHELGMSQEYALNNYFSDSQIRGKTNDQLLLSFVNDTFMVLDYLKSKGRSINELTESADKNPEKNDAAYMLARICENIDRQMKEQGFRDYADQMMDTIKFFRENNDFVPKFEHVLVDEYQDVNSTQIELLDLLDGKNIFAVGDPRQSVFGWRGSDIKYILDFGNKYPGSELVTLTKNYRSTAFIVGLMNRAISKMNLPDLEAANEGTRDMRLLGFETESAEHEFIVQRILHSDVMHEDIFILARTNRQLNEIAAILSAGGIKYILKSDEVNRSVEAKKGEVTLATIHAIKGLEAKMVFVAGCTSLNFPCRTSDHPATEMINIEEYDKEEEERRLFYVAISRAMESLYLTYTGKIPTYFVTEDMKKLIGSKPARPGHGGIARPLFGLFREWRAQQSRLEGVPPYIVMKDETISDIIEQRPATMRELEEIRGLGPSRIKRFGKDILEILGTK